MSVRDREHFYPDRYRVSFHTVSGLCSYDVYSEAEARRAMRDPSVTVYAQWYCRDENGRTYIDDEVLR
jgi:hypothetical protein